MINNIFVGDYIIVKTEVLLRLEEVPSLDCVSVPYYCRLPLLMSFDEFGLQEALGRCYFLNCFLTLTIFSSSMCTENNYLSCLLLLHVLQHAGHFCEELFPSHVI